MKDDGLTAVTAFSYRVGMSHLKRKKGRLIVKWSFHGDRGKVQLVIRFTTSTFTVL